MRQLDIQIVIVGTLVVAMLVTIGARASHGQEHHGHQPQHMTLHEQFYSKWNRPDMRHGDGSRYSSCCNNQDCEPAPLRHGAQGWEAWHRLTQRWVPVPDAILEQNNADMVESIDGQSHACISASGTTVYCATLGAGN